MAVNKSIQLGSGRLYLIKRTDAHKTIPALKALCVDENNVALIKGGCQIEYNIDTKEIYDDLRVVTHQFIVGEHAKLTTGVITFDARVLEALLNNETTEEDGSILVGSQGLSTMDEYVVIFESVPNTDNVIRRFGFIGVSTAGLKMDYAAEDATVIDVTFDAIADEDGRYLRIEEETKA